MLGWEQRAAGRARRRAARRARHWSQRLGELAEAYGIGRNIHVGETALGIKGRIGFEAGAALLLIGAHRELEKLVLTKWQAFWKDQLGRFYGDRLHEGQYFDPSLRDIEALITSSQARVTGETRVRLAAGPVPGGRHPEPALDDGHLGRHLWRGEPSLDRRRGARLRPGRGGAVAARGRAATESERRDTRARIGCTACLRLQPLRLHESSTKGA